MNYLTWKNAEFLVQRMQNARFILFLVSLVDKENSGDSGFVIKIYALNSVLIILGNSIEIAGHACHRRDGFLSVMPFHFVCHINKFVLKKQDEC